MRSLLLLVALGAASITGCSSSGTATTDRGDCPTAPVDVVATVDQWGDIVSSLAGDCGAVTTIITGSSGDPHEYEPTPADVAAFTGADVVVMNGLGYDHWADDALDTLPRRPVVVDGADVVGAEPDANPHLWYSPTYVHQIADAVHDALAEAAPDATAYFDARADAWARDMQPYDDEVASIRQQHAGAPYAATEPVFAYMGEALGLDDRTPEGYASASANESEPGAADVAAFDAILRDHEIDVLVVNTQTEGSIPDQLRDTAVGSGVPVVEVTETIPAGATSFVDWQLGQLQALSAALAS
jgi:zinc/manganese transport system substrate-binding protein